MFRRAACIAVAAFTMISCNAAESETPAISLDTDDSKILYTIGLAMSRQVQQFEFSEHELAVIQKGLADGTLKRDAAVDLQTWGPKIDSFLQARLAATGERQMAEGKAFLEKTKGEPGAEVLDSGMIVLAQQQGVGPHPGPTATVKLNYRGTFPSGDEFDSSAPDSPVSFALNGVVPCFSQGIQKMKVGGKARLVCPPELAYGPRGNPPRVPPNATLVFEVELLEITEPEAEAQPQQ